MNDNKKPFVWYSSWDEGFDAIVKNAPDLALKLYEAIRKYGTTGEDTELDLPAIALFNQAKGDIDRAKERYENMVEAGKKRRLCNKIRHRKSGTNGT